MKKIFVVFALVVSYGLLGQDKEIDLIEFVKEIQMTKKSGSNMKMVWWIPTEYWKIATSGSPYVTQEGLRDLEQIVNPFTIIAALDGDIALGNINYKDTLAVQLEIQDNQIFSPLKTEEIPNDVKNVLRTLKPVFVNMIGEMGKNFNFYVFHNTSDGKKILNPKTSGGFNFILNEEPFEWLLPLESFVPMKKCPVDDKLMSGTWVFCPWHGNKLEN